MRIQTARRTALLALALLLFTSAPLRAEVFYIDPVRPYQGCTPTANFNPEGSEGMPAGRICGSWSGVTWADGNSYYQKGGTTARVNLIVADKLITKGITLSSYGQGKATIDAGGHGCGLNLRDVSNITVSKLVFINAGWAGVQLHARTRDMANLSFDAIEVRNSLSDRGGGGWGFYNESGGVQGGIVNLRITNSSFKNCARHAVYVGGKVRGVLFQGNVVEAGNLGSVPYYWGCCFNGRSLRSADSSIELTPMPGGERANIWSMPAPLEVLDAAVHYTGPHYGFLRKGSSPHTLAPGEWYYSAVERRLYVALGGTVNPNDMDNNPANGKQRLQVIGITTWAENIEVLNNCFLGTKNATKGEAAGFGFEFGVRNATVSGNYSASNHGCGYLFLANRNVKVLNNISCGNGGDGFHLNVVDSFVLERNISVRDSALLPNGAGFGIRTPFLNLRMLGNTALSSQAFGFANTGMPNAGAQLVSSGNEAAACRLGGWRLWTRSATDRDVTTPSNPAAAQACQTVPCQGVTLLPAALVRQ